MDCQSPRRHCARPRAINATAARPNKANPSAHKPWGITNGVRSADKSVDPNVIESRASENAPQMKNPIDTSMADSDSRCNTTRQRKGIFCNSTSMRTWPRSSKVPASPQLMPMAMR